MMPRARRSTWTAGDCWGDTGSGQHGAQLLSGGGKVQTFLSDLAVTGNVSASTQNQAFNALLFLYREILRQPFENVQAVRATRPVRLPVVLTVEEARQVIIAMSGVPQLVVKTTSRPR